MAYGAQINEDMRFQVRWWRVERAGWLLMGLFVAAAAAGVFGSGPLSRARAGVADGPQVEYPRFLRARTVAEFTLTLPPSGRRRHTVVMGPALLERFEVESVVPPALDVRTGGGLRYVIDAHAGRPAQVWVRLRARQAGTLRGAFIADGRTLPVRALVYP